MIFSFVVRVDRTLLSSPSRSCYTSGQIYSRIYERSQPWQTLDAYETVHCSGSGIHPLLWDHLCMHTGYEFLVFSSIPPVLHRAFFHNHAFCIMIHVDGHFTRVAIRSPFYEGSRIRIALNHTILFKNEIRVLFQRAIDAGSELLQRRYIIFKGNSRVRPRRVL